MRRLDARRAAVTGAAVGFIAAGLHGFVDTSLHIPANLMSASVLVGGLLAASGAQEDGSERGPKESGERSGRS